MPQVDMSQFPVLMTPRQVADVFAVGPKTITRWADAGHLPCVLTVGGHRRYRRDDVVRLAGLAEGLTTNPG